MMPEKSVLHGGGGGDGGRRNWILSSYNTQEYISNESKNLKLKGKILKLLKDNIRKRIWLR